MHSMTPARQADADPALYLSPFFPFLFFAIFRVQMKMDAKLKQLPTAVDAPPKRRPVKRHRSFHRGLQDSAHSHSHGSSDSVGRGVESTSPYLAGTDPTLSPHIPGDLKVASDKPRSKSSSDMTRNTSVSTNDSMDVAQAKIERVQGGGEGSTCRLMQCVVM